MVSGGLKRLQGLCAAVLAGGNSSRMGIDKAFLKVGNKYFIQIITRELNKITDRIVVVIGEKEPMQFKNILGNSIHVINDTYRLSNPIGGMISAFEYFADNEVYVAIVACDLPLLKNELVAKLYRKAAGHDAAVAVWKNGDIEPLCAVYSAKKGLEAGKKTIKNRIVGCKNLVKNMKDVVYVATDELKDVDRELASFRNINTEKEYRELLNTWNSDKSNR